MRKILILAFSLLLAFSMARAAMRDLSSMEIGNRDKHGVTNPVAVLGASGPKVPVVVYNNPSPSSNTDWSIVSDNDASTLVTGLGLAITGIGGTPPFSSTCVWGYTGGTSPWSAEMILNMQINTRFSSLARFIFYIGGHEIYSDSTGATVNWYVNGVSAVTHANANGDWLTVTTTATSVDMAVNGAPIISASTTPANPYYFRVGSKTQSFDTGTRTCAFYNITIWEMQ